MFLLFYDIETRSKSGRKRLRNTARSCENYGRRLQKSVFLIETKSDLRALLGALEGAQLLNDDLLIFAVSGLRYGKVNFQRCLIV
jgi:CRISPR-associated protein Cas2